MPGFGYGFLGNLFFMNGGCQPYGLWSYNPWYGMFTYLPYGGTTYSPYGYTYSSPVTVPVRKQPVVVSGPVRRPMYAPARGSMSLAERRPLTLAVNRLSAPGFHGGMGATRGFGFSSSAASSGSGSSGSVGSTRTVGLIGSTASSSSSGIATHGVGAASSGSVSSGGGHR
jgi:hypothetical protein